MNHTTGAELEWRPAPAETFTGRTWFGPMVRDADPMGLFVIGVLFEPAARTHWHSHPAGQTLYVASGSGIVGNRSGDLRSITAGDVVTVPPGEVHWHGAVEGSYMMHLSITTGGPTVWT
ncbi:MAG: cupin domain-containing protein, partial [Acidimicrobiia bacterium]|nr:cupin domain-containing protein [Acidimicrobiia bacterium]